MFSQVCVKNSVHRGTCTVRGIYGGGVPSMMCMASSQGVHGRGGACVVGGMCGRGCIGRGMHGRGGCMAGECVVGEMATAADGTHPTVMH